MAARIGPVFRNVPDCNPVSLRSRPELSGWSGLDLPRRVGGDEWTAREMARLFRACGKHDVELRDAIGGGHARLLTLPRTRRFDPILSDVADGKAFCAIAITEPDTGSDISSIVTVAEPNSGGYRLRGTKQHISRIDECTHYIVYAAIKRESPAVTAFLVPHHAKGLTVELMSPMGMAKASWGRMILQDVDVPATARIGGEGEGLSLFVRHFSYWRLMMASAAIGCAEEAVDAAILRMKRRDAFGGPIGRFSHLQMDLAKHAARLRMAWLLVENVANQFDARSWPVFDAAMVKAECVEIAISAVEWVMNVFGAAGYDTANNVEKRYRDLAGLRVADGTTDVLRGQVARSILGDRLYELSLNRRVDDELVTDMQRRRYW